MYLSLSLRACIWVQVLLQGSLDALNKVLQKPVSVNRFRPKYGSSFFKYPKFHYSMGPTAHSVILKSSPWECNNSSLIYDQFNAFMCLLFLVFFSTSILVDGCEPFSEDLWTEIRIDKFIFQGVRLCARCKVLSCHAKIFYLIWDFFVSFL